MGPKDLQPDFLNSLFLAEVGEADKIGKVKLGDPSKLVHLERKVPHSRSLKISF